MKKKLDLNYYQKPSSDNWTGRDSGEELHYIHEKIITKSISELSRTDKKDIAIIGYATDEGVKRNQGRPGAENGPKAIRTRFSKLSNHLSSEIDIYDVGDIIVQDGNMEAGQDNLAIIIYQVLSQGYHPMVLGGGHDIALGHYRGIKSYLKETEKIGIINFDAHLDLRQPINNGNSGTPFYQICQEVEKENFHYMAIGIQEIANHRGLYDTARTKNVKIITLQECESEWKKVKDRIQKYMDGLDSIYITIDLDGFSSAYSPGVSAPSPLGLTPNFVQKALELIYQSDKVTSVDLAEMNPKYDISEATAKLASALIYQCIKLN